MRISENQQTRDAVSSVQQSERRFEMQASKMAAEHEDNIMMMQADHERIVAGLEQKIYFLRVIGS